MRYCYENKDTGSFVEEWKICQPYRIYGRKNEGAKFSFILKPFGATEKCVFEKDEGTVNLKKFTSEICVNVKNVDLYFFDILPYWRVL